MVNEKVLRNLLLEIFERRKDAIRISPAWLATEAMQEIDPGRTADEREYFGCELALRQIARGICRKFFEPDDEYQSAQHSLWPDLQTRYPAAHEQDVEYEYVKLEHLSERDVRFNVNRLRSEARAKLSHADALEAWWDERAMSEQ